MKTDAIVAQMSLSGLGPFGILVFEAFRKTSMTDATAYELAVLLDQAATVHERRAIERLS